MANVLGFMAKIAPWVTAAASGNVPALIGLAAKTVGDVTGKKVDSTADSISAAIAGATPEQILALKQADADLQVKLQALGFQNVEDLAKIAADDRASAREREEHVQDLTPRILAYVTVGAFVFVCVYVLSGHAKVETVLAGTLIGYISAKAEQVLTYYFGSSAGSDRKTELLAQAPAIQK